MIGHICEDEVMSLCGSEQVRLCVSNDSRRNVSYIWLARTSGEQKCYTVKHSTRNSNIITGGTQIMQPGTSNLIILLFFGGSFVVEKSETFCQHRFEWGCKKSGSIILSHHANRWMSEMASSDFSYLWKDALVLWDVLKKGMFFY